MLSAALLSAVIAAAPSLESSIASVAALQGEPRIVSAAGLAPDETPILTIENPSAFDPGVTRHRLVVVGADDQTTADAVLAAVRWLKTAAPRSIRDRWVVSAMPLARFAEADKLSLARWVTFQAPDLVVEVGSGGAVHVDGVHVETAPVGAAIDALTKLLSGATPARSVLHDTIAARVRREPLTIAGVLASRYPAASSVSYIPAVAWVNTLKLATITGDASLRAKVLEQTKPWLEGQKMFGARIQLTAIAGSMVFADLAHSERNEAAAKLAVEGAALAAAQKADGVAQYGGGWTDDMFMAASILSRASALPGRGGDLDTAARLITTYAGRLQRPDGLFNHAVEGPIAWGRGNGFAALGVVETLTALPSAHPMRAAILEIYRRQMAAAKAQQAPDGMWREIIDDPAAYREETATAMLFTAMARGIRLGWIERSYLPVAQRAWRALAAHVVDDGTVVDVCASTGSGPTRKYYFDRPAITGADDRGGAMALLASMEMYELQKR